MSSDNVTECKYCRELFNSFCTQDICRECCAKGYCARKEDCMGYPVIVKQVKDKENPSRR